MRSKIVGIALALPSTLLTVGWLLFKLVEKGMISKGVAVAVIIALTAQTFVLIVVYANRRNNKNK